MTSAPDIAALIERLLLAGKSAYEPNALLMQEAAAALERLQRERDAMMRVIERASLGALDLSPPPKEDGKDFAMTDKVTPALYEDDK